MAVIVGSPRMPRPEAVAIAKSFIALIEDCTDQLVVAGSLRRRLAYVGDIEVVATPQVELRRLVTPGLFGDVHSSSEVDLLHECMEHLLDSGTVQKRLDKNGSPRWGETLKYLTYQGARVDLFTPCEERFGWILLLRTGPAQFSRQLVVPRGRRTKDKRPGLLPDYIVPKDGWLTYRTSGERIETPTEMSVFELLGLPFREPWERV